MTDGTVERCSALRTEGNALFAKARFAEAVLRYGEALELDGADAKALCNRAAAYLALGQLEPALADASAAARLAPRWAKPPYRAALALEGLDRLPEALDMYARVIELEPVGNVAVKDKMAALRRRLARDDCGQPPGPSRVSVEGDGSQCPPAAAAVQATSDRVQAQLDRVQVTSTTQDHSIALGVALKGRHTTDDEDLQQLLLPACRLTASMLLADHRVAAGNGPAGCCCLFLALPSGSTLLSRGICFVSAMVFWVPQQPRAVFWLMSGDTEGVLATAWQAYGRGGVPVTRGNLLRGDFDDARAAVLQGDGAVDTFCPDFLSRCSDRPPFLEATYLPVSADGVPLGPSAPLQSLLATLPVGDR
eukprot:EG_transcript_14542